MTTYPSLNEFWPAVRAKNFVMELGKQPGNYAQNMETLASIAKVHVKQMCHVNPLTFAEREIGSDDRWTTFYRDKLIRILGKNTYAHLDKERSNTWGSASWAYHKKEPIPSWSPWQVQIDTILYLCKEIDAAVPFSHERVSLAGALFFHLLRYEPFLRANPQVCDVAAQKVAEFKALPCAEPIMKSLVEVEELLERIRPSTAPEAAAQEAAAQEPAQEPEQEPIALESIVLEQEPAQEPVQELAKDPKESADFLFDMGCQYEHGIIVEKNMAEAVRHYVLAAEKGYAPAQSQLGSCYFWGKGLAKNVAEGVRYFTLAAKAGYAQAQHNLGYCYDRGIGVKKDLAAAVRYYMLAAEAGNANAQCNLATCYANGDGVAKDKVAAVRWYTLSAEGGCTESRYQLGVCYANGTGVAKDKAAAIRYYTLAAQAGHEKAKFRLHVLAPPEGVVVVNMGYCLFTIF